MIGLTILVCAVAGALESPLVSVSAAAEMPDAIFVDARKAEDFEAGHIEGATNVDVESLAENRDGVMGLIKPLNDVLPILRGAGVDPSKPVIVYSAMGETPDLVRSTRLFWVLEYLGYENVGMLDGGLAAWTAKNKPTATGASTVQPLKTLELRPDESRRATADEIAEAIKGEVLIQDNRSPEQYSGASKSGAVKKAGHLPNAVNVPAMSLLNEDGTFKTQGEIASAVGEVSGKPIVTYCNTGRSATIGYFAWRMLGHEDVSMYDGSMSEWTSNEENPVIAEETAAP